MYEAFVGFLNALIGICYELILSIGNDVNVDVTSTYKVIWDAMTRIANNVAVPIGVMVVVLFFLLAVMDKVSSENLTLEVMLKEIIKLAIGLYLVTNAVGIITNCVYIGNGILNSVFGSIEMAPVEQATFTVEQLKSLGGLWGAMYFAMAIVVIALIEIIIILIMKAIALVRLMEICVRASLSPLALSDSFAGNFLQSHAMNFIRSFTAVCIQGSFILIIAYMIPTMMTNIIVNIDSIDMFGIQALFFLLEMLIVSIAGLVLMFKSGSIAKELLGAR